MKTTIYSKIYTASLPRLLFLLFFAMTLLPNSCRKEDDEVIPQPKVYAEENPLAAFLIASGFTKVVETVNSGYYESAIVFAPTVNGKINAVTLRIPDVATNVRVTIWDNATKAVIQTILIDVSSSHTTVTKSIDPLNVEKDKEYMISMNTNDWFENGKPAGGDATYPITVGNIKFLGYRWGSGGTQKYPINSSSSYTAGDVSFIFQQVE